MIIHFQQPFHPLVTSGFPDTGILLIKRLVYQLCRKADLLQPQFLVFQDRREGQGGRFS